MKRLLLYAAALALIIPFGYAITVDLSSDKTELKINESISFQLAVSNGESVGGGFNVYRKINGSFQQARKTTFTSSCTLCKGTSPLGDLNESISFIPLHAGEYRAVADYGGISSEINFTVDPVTTTTTSTTTTITTSRPTTTTTTSTTTTTTTTSTTTTTTTTTLPVTTTTVPEYGRGNSTVIYFFGIVLVLMVLVIAYTRKKS